VPNAVSGLGIEANQDIETQWIDVPDGIIQHIGIGVDPTIEPDRIALQIPSDLRIVISEVVVE
jgi:hypothetical protein